MALKDYHYALIGISKNKTNFSNSVSYLFQLIKSMRENGEVCVCFCGKQAVTMENRTIDQKDLPTAAGRGFYKHWFYLEEFMNILTFFGWRNNEKMNEKTRWKQSSSLCFCFWVITTRNCWLFTFQHREDCRSVCYIPSFLLLKIDLELLMIIWDVVFCELLECGEERWNF